MRSRLYDCHARTPQLSCLRNFLIQTAGRSEEVLHAELREIDIDNATWTIPAWRSNYGGVSKVSC